MIVDEHVRQPLGCNSPDPLFIICWVKAGKDLKRVPLQTIIAKRLKQRWPSPRRPYHQRTPVYLAGTPGSPGGWNDPRGIYQRLMRESAPWCREIGEASHDCLRRSFKGLPRTREMTENSKSSGLRMFGRGKEFLVLERRATFFPA